MEENKQVQTQTFREVERITEEKLVTWMEAFGVAKQLQPNEKKQFVEIAMAYQLNPFKREIYCTAYGEADRRQLSIITGYEVYLKRAERTGDLAGWNCTTEGSVEKKDLRAIITIHRKSWTMPLVHEVEYSEYIQTKKDGTPTKFWSGKPKTMIKKVAMAQGFRLAFPDELGGMPYTSDELPSNMSGVIDTTAEPHQGPQRKQPELTQEELAAKAAQAKESYHQEQEAQKSEPAKPQTPPEADKGLSVKGKVIAHYPPKGKGPHSFKVDGFNDYLKTFDEMLAEALIDHKAAGDEIEVGYEVVTKGEYSNNMITGITVSA